MLIFSSNLTAFINVVLFFLAYLPSHYFLHVIVADVPEIFILKYLIIIRSWLWRSYLHILPHPLGVLGSSFPYLSCVLYFLLWRSFLHFIVAYGRCMRLLVPVHIILFGFLGHSFTLIAAFRRFGILLSVGIVRLRLSSLVLVLSIHIY